MGLDGGRVWNGYGFFNMNTIERYLQAQSRTEMLARYYSYPLNVRTRPTPTVQLVSSFPWSGYEYSLHDTRDETSRRNAWPSKYTREKHSLSAIQSVGLNLGKERWWPNLWLSTRRSYPLDLARIIGMGMAMECAHLRKSIRHNTYGWHFHTQLLPHGIRGVWRTSRQCEVYQTLPL